MNHPLGLEEGATENAAVVQALLDDLVGRGLDPAAGWLFIVDGAKALTKAIRCTFGRDTPIQRCQVHKARNIADRLPKALQAPVRRALRQAWELDDAAPCCMGGRHGCSEPYANPGVCDANVFRTSKVEHAVQHVGGDGHLGRLAAIRL